MNTQQVAMLLSAVVAGYVGLAFVSGASNPVPEAQAETSGTRLKAKATTGSDGSLLYDAEILHDTTLDIDCKFKKSADGALRCLPHGNGVMSENANFRYADDDCTSAIVYVDPGPSGCTPVVPSYFTRTDYVPYCGATAEEIAIHVYAVGELLGAVGQVYVINPQGACVEAGGGAGIPYALGAEMPASSFVAGTAGID